MIGANWTTGTIYLKRAIAEDGAIQLFDTYICSNLQTNKIIHL